MAAEDRRAQVAMQTTLASVALIRGEVLFSGQMRVDGRIVGDVSADPIEGSELHVGPQGRIEGKVAVARLVVEGTVIGPVSARERLDLRRGGHLVGEIAYRDLQIQHGSTIEGSLAALDGNGDRMNVPLRLVPQRRDG